MHTRGLMERHREYYYLLGYEHIVYEPRQLTANLNFKYSTIRRISNVYCTQMLERIVCLVNDA